MMKVLTKQDLERALLEGIQDAYPNERVVARDIVKDNGYSYRGIIIEKHFSAVVNVDELYNTYTTEDSIDEAVKCSLRFIKDNSVLPAGIDLDLITDYEAIKDLLLPYVMNTELNMELIKSNNLVTLPYMDLSLGLMIYYPNASAKIRISQTLIDKWEVPLDQVFVQAMNNIKEDYRFQRIDDLATKMMDDLGETGELGEETDYLNNTNLSICDEGYMYVLTNNSGFFGAAHIFNTDILNRIGECMGMDFYILPSSIHEIILLKCFDDGSETEQLKELVKQVNYLELDREEVLSESIYKYSCDTKSVSKVA